MKSLYTHILSIIALAISFAPLGQPQALNNSSPAPAAFSEAAVDQIDQSSAAQAQYVADELIVKLKPEIASVLSVDSMAHGRFNSSELDILSSQYQVSSMSRVFGETDPVDLLASQYGMGNILKLTVAPDVNLQSAIRAFRANPNVEFAEPNYTVGLLYTPNDPKYKDQWGLSNSNDKDIDAPEAWSITKGRSEVMIAVIDTGVLYTHPDLRGSRMRTDIDKDFANNDNDALDDQGHGTHVAGVIAASTNNKAGIAGVCPNCSILPVKVLNSSGQGTADNVAKGIKYAADKHAQIISMSLGITPKCGCSKTIAQAINYAFDKGSLLIAASGNDGVSSISYPSSSPRVMSIGATNKNDAKTSWSNYGGGLDLVAPGDTILSTWLGNTYTNKSGTSMSTPFASGVAGLVLSRNLSRSNVRIWWILQHSTDKLLNQTGWISKVGYGRLNAFKAVTITKNGVVTAPVDTCSKEPESGCGDCSTALVLNEIANADADRQDLYSFRDQVLSQTEMGKAWIDIFYKHNQELATILLKDKSLLKQTVTVYKDLAPALRHVLVSGQGEAVTLTASQIKGLDRLKTAILKQASPAMAADIEREWQSVSLENYAGQDAFSIWTAINQGIQSKP